MNENTTNNAIVLNQDSAAEEYTKILRGRYVTNITIGDDEVRTTTLTLDNSDTLTIEGNEGCMGCVNGWYHLENAYKRGNHTARIMNAHVEYSQDDNYHDGYEVYTIFVMIDGNPSHLPLATMQGHDENGYYGTGFTLTVRRGAGSNTATK
jgi:hypothetical protein